jgi:hypothetical protein
MPRVARVVIADVAHHVTQRGNGWQFILASTAGRLVYLGKPGNVVPGTCEKIEFGPFINRVTY